MAEITLKVIDAALKKLKKEQKNCYCTKDKNWHGFCAKHGVAKIHAEDAENVREFLRSFER